MVRIPFTFIDENSEHAKWYIVRFRFILIGVKSEQCEWCMFIKFTHKRIYCHDKYIFETDEIWKR